MVIIEMETEKLIDTQVYGLSKSMLVPLTKVENVGGKGQGQIFFNSSTEFEVLVALPVEACL